MSLRSFAASAGFAALAIGFVISSAASAALFDQPSTSSSTNLISGTTPSGLTWAAVASGTALPIRSTNTAANGAPGAVAYYNVDTGQLQIDPKGWDLSLFNFTYTTGTVNVLPGAAGPLLYASGTSPVSATVSGATGVANQLTLPAGTWGGGITVSKARVGAAVSLIASPTLATSYDPGNGAANGTSPYSTNTIGTPSVPGWFNQPWSFPWAGDAAGSAVGLIDSGSLAVVGANTQNWKVFGVTGNANANILGFGNYAHVFQYTINGTQGNQVGAVIPVTAVPEPPTVALAGISVFAAGMGLFRRRTESSTHDAGDDDADAATS